jgi:hypothetical protein
LSFGYDLAGRLHFHGDMKPSLLRSHIFPAILSIALLSSGAFTSVEAPADCIESLPATLGALHAQKPKPKVDTSTEQLFYEMAQSDGTGMAEIPVGAIVENEQCAHHQASTLGSDNQQAGTSFQ